MQPQAVLAQARIHRQVPAVAAVAGLLIGRQPGGAAVGGLAVDIGGAQLQQLRVVLQRGEGQQAAAAALATTLRKAEAAVVVGQRLALQAEHIQLQRPLQRIAQGDHGAATLVGAEQQILAQHAVVAQGHALALQATAARGGQAVVGQLPLVAGGVVLAEVVVQRINLGLPLPVTTTAFAAIAEAAVAGVARGVRVAGRLLLVDPVAVAEQAVEGIAMRRRGPDLSGLAGVGRQRPDQLVRGGHLALRRSTALRQRCGANLHLGLQQGGDVAIGVEHHHQQRVAALAQRAAEVEEKRGVAATDQRGDIVAVQLDGQLVARADAFQPRHAEAQLGLPGFEGQRLRGAGLADQPGQQQRTAVTVKVQEFHGLFLTFAPAAAHAWRAVGVAHWGRTGARSGARPGWVWPQLRTSTVTRALLLLSLLSPTCCWSSTDRFSRCVPLPR